MKSYPALYHSHFPHGVKLHLCLWTSWWTLRCRQNSSTLRQLMLYNSLCCVLLVPVSHCNQSFRHRYLFHIISTHSSKFSDNLCFITNIEFSPSKILRIDSAHGKLPVPITTDFFAPTLSVARIGSPSYADSSLPVMWFTGPIAQNNVLQIP